MPNSTNRDLAYYPASYTDARAKFLARAARIMKADSSAELRSFQVPCKKGDDDLFMDDLYLPALGDPETLLILTSGVHGIEAYTGSALQAMFMDELLPLVPRSNVGIWIVHCLNPFGFKYHRRSTENNVNLNRNFAASEELFATRNEGYDRIADFFEPKAPVGSLLASKFQTASFITQALTTGGFSQAELNQAISQGQFHHPRGAEYGGRKREPQIEAFIQRLEAIHRPYRNLILFDLHTGLGERYELHLIPSDEERGSDPELAQLLFPSHPVRNGKNEKRPYSWTPTDTEGFYRTYGDLNSLLPAIARDGQRILAVTFEFGTLGNGLLEKIENLDRLCLENRGFHEGYESERARTKVAHRFSELFYPSQAKWRINAVSRTRRTWQRVIERIQQIKGDE